MRLREKTREGLQALRLSEVPAEWVESLWDGNFCGEAVSLPYQAVEEGVLLNEEGWECLVEACRHWPARTSNNEGAGFWTTLMEEDVSYKCILAVLYCIMERTKLRPVDRICALHAARLYMILLQLPGSGGYKLYHPMLFQKAVNVAYLYPESGGATTETEKAVSQPVGKRGPKGGRGKRKRKALHDEDEEEEDMDSLEGGVVMETGREHTIVRLLKLFVKTLQDYLWHQSLAEHSVSRYQLLQALLHLARKELEPNVSLVLRRGGAREADSAPPDDSVAMEESLAEDQEGHIGHAAPMFVLAWACLDAMCRRLHGSVETITSEVFRQLLPSLLMLSEDGGVATAATLPSSLTLPSKHALAFVNHVTRSMSDQVHMPLIKLIQHVCTKIPDKAEYRNKMAVVVSQLLSLLSDERYSDMLDWLYKFSRNTKVGYRVFALDLVSRLMTTPLRAPPADSLSREASYRLTYKFLVRMVLSRCSDKAPSVRTRALTCLASAAAASDCEELVAAVHGCVFQQSTTTTITATANQVPGPERFLIVEMVHRRTTDEKVGVRKAGLQALEAIVQMDKNTTRNSDIAAIYKRCLDPSLSVRKQAITSLTTLLLERRTNVKLQSYWLDGVLPMVMDKEPGGEEKCLQLLQEVLLDNLVPLHRSTGEDEHLAWQLLSLIAEENRLELQRHLRRAMGQWSRAGRLTAALTKAVCSHTEDREHLKAAWMLLAEISQFSKTVESKFLFDNWNEYKSVVSSEASSPLVQILITIGNLAGNISKIAIEDIKDDIIQLLKQFSLSPPVIQAAVNTVCLICCALSSKQDYQSSLDAWCVPLLKACQDYLTVFIKEKSCDADLVSRMEVEIQTYLFTLGEVAQLCPSHTPHHLCLMVQSILLASSEVSATPPSSRENSQTSSLPNSQVFQGSQGVPGSQGYVALLSGLSGQALSPSLRAHAYITLGKLCLQNEDLAKKSVVHMARELLISKHPAIRNNIIVILCDLAIRYSAKVDPYISSISSCLKDESLLVRKQTLTLLARLLQEDYIKWRGSLFFHCVSCLVDSDLSGFAEFCLTHLLQVRHPGMFYQHFVESIFFFNSYEKHKVYNRFKQTSREKELFSLKGKKNAKKRMTIYTFLLSSMTDEQRFQLTAKLCQEVIGGLVDGAIPLDDEGVGVIKDTLAILASKEIKLTTLRRNVGEELSEEGDQVRAAVAKAQTKIVTQLVKRNVMENVVPIVIAAKHLFEKEHDPLLKDLLLYLKELMQDYRSEVGEILAGDPQLVQEIQFDLKRFDEEQRRTIQTPPISVTPHTMMVSPLLSPGVLGPVATTTVMATPPKLKTPAGGQQRTAPRAVGKTPFRLPLAMSPLVVIHTPLGVQGNNRTPTRPPRQVNEAQDAGNQDVASPSAARERVNAMNQDSMIRTPATVMIGRRTPALPLQRAVLLSTAKKAGLRAKAAGLATPAPTDVTVLDGRLASTPEGLAESISFRASSIIPPSPIPPNSTFHRPPLPKPPKPGEKSKPQATDPESDANKGKRRSKRLRVASSRDLGNADILMPSPNAESQPLGKWRVKVKS